MPRSRPPPRLGDCGRIRIPSAARPSGLRSAARAQPLDRNVRGVVPRHRTHRLAPLGWWSYFRTDVAGLPPSEAGDAMCTDRVAGRNEMKLIRRGLAVVVVVGLSVSVCVMTT